ncbi:unnamed protein product [Triticum aestivum]|uniref:VWFA domain-containing protein n=2 Tax=Triticum aestivum TaxID=4565 RepID=A0A9R1EN48_WHEAT|nr:uncharacterized protein LOC123051074 [Triticum aestivum]KAF7013124.1 hypothetical protein CFC21_027241 [Triticum aestivum]KAF7013126.1 hypothetical protein CFC21_027243 [Triticum aestivum]SPT15662.1 unnamed protein product [Triticum aestivum]
MSRSGGGGPGRGPLGVVIVYAFDRSTSTVAWDKVDNEIFWMVQEKLTHFTDTWLGYTYIASSPNKYTSDMKLVDSTEIKANGYKESSAWRRIAVTKDMPSALSQAHKMINDQGDLHGIILFFSDGLINKGAFFDGAEEFISKVPVHTFTLSGDAYNHVLRAIAANSPGGTFSPLQVPDKPSLSLPFSQVLDSILNGTKHPSTNSGRRPLDVVLVYAFDCTTTPSPAWDKMEHEIFWLVQEKLKHFADSCLGYTYVMSTPNTCTYDMKQVDLVETKLTGYAGSSAWRKNPCTKNMASGLPMAHKLMSDHGHLNGVILLFSDGLINKGDFFDGAEDFISKVPVHTFTLAGGAYNHGLRAIAANSPGGTFSRIPVPDKPSLSVPFSQILDSILNGTKLSPGRLPLDVVLVYAFDCTITPSLAWDKMEQEIFWLVQEKLTHFKDSRLGYTYVMSTPNTYTHDVKLVDSKETKTTGYSASSAWRKNPCTKNMASGLPVAHKLMRDHGCLNGIILLFSDGLVNKGDFFDGAEDFVSKVSVHTFTLAGGAYNHGLHAMAANSPGGVFHPEPVPNKPSESVSFSQLLDSILIAP